MKESFWQFAREFKRREHWNIGGFLDDLQAEWSRRNRDNLSDLVQEAARDLPEGYRIKIDVEHEAGGVSLIRSPFGEIIDYPSNHETIEESFRDAITYAKELDDPNQSSQQA